MEFSWKRSKIHGCLLSFYRLHSWIIGFRKSKRILTEKLNELVIKKILNFLFVYLVKDLWTLHRISGRTWREGHVYVSSTSGLKHNYGLMSACMPYRPLSYKPLSVTIKYHALEKKDQPCLCFTLMILALTKCPLIRDCYRTTLRPYRAWSLCSLPCWLTPIKKKIVTTGNEITRTKNSALIFL